MIKVFCSVRDEYVSPLFEVFDGGDFILSSYHDIESDSSDMSIYFEDPALTEDARGALAKALSVVVPGAVEIRTEEVPDEDWKFAYRRHFKTEKVSDSIYTVPEWESEGFFAAGTLKKGEIAIVSDPGLAFGTGKHETTKACLQYIDEIAKAQSDKARTFLDMGCGSGILSIAAAKLGFADVCGFDIDADAVEASRANAALNHVDIKFHEFALGKGAVTLDESIEAAAGVYPDLALQQPEAAKTAAPFGKADVVVANILGPLLIAFADEIAGYVGDTLIVSGILNELYADVLAAFKKLGFHELSHKTIGEWTTGRLERKN